MIQEAFQVVERVFRDPAAITKIKPAGNLPVGLILVIKIQKNFVLYKQLICIKNAQIDIEILYRSTTMH